jgi:hypothetical protein
VTKLLLACGLLLSLGAGPALAAEPAPLRVPVGQPVLPDGQCSAQEWSDAREVALSEGARLSVKQAGDFVFLCIHFPRPALSGLDLYLSPPDGKLYNLHASAKLGERLLTNGAWPDWIWWKHTGWTANVMRVDTWEPRSFLPDEAKELQVCRDRFPGSPWRVRIEVQGDFAAAFPAGTSNLKSDGWLVLEVP